MCLQKYSLRLVTKFTCTYTQYCRATSPLQIPFRRLLQQAGSNAVNNTNPDK